MSKVSIIIPSRNENYLQKTINDILAKAAGDIEILVGLDGYQPLPNIQEDKRIIIYSKPFIGMRAMVNFLACKARGEYIMKCDAHCIFGEGFDEILQKDCDKDWIAVPKRYCLDPDTWDIDKKDNLSRDAHYISYPFAISKKTGFGMFDRVWEEKSQKHIDIHIDDEMITQGSCYFMHRNYFKLLDEVNYGKYGQESMEIFMRTWLSGGRCVINKNTWYAHLMVGKKYERNFRRLAKETRKSRFHSIDLWFCEKHSLQHSFEWLIDKFWPVPTWPDDWKDHKQEVNIFNMNAIKKEGF